MERSDPFGAINPCSTHATITRVCALVSLVDIAKTTALPLVAASLI